MSTLKAHAYRLAGPALQYRISRTKFALGLRPSINPARPAWQWPAPYRAAVVISADFELAWAWRYARTAQPERLAARKSRQARANFPVLLDLFDRHELPVTWATVGHLFLDRCDGRHAELPRPAPFSNEEWHFGGGDWFDADPGHDWEQAPEWYAPDLIEALRSARTPHEVGCHSFSHISLADDHCPPEVAVADLRACQEIARDQGLTLRSFVFPGNFVGNLPALAAAGFTTYRAGDGRDLDWPVRDAHGLWRMPKGVCIEPPLASWPHADWLTRLRAYLARAIERGALCHFWFHPSLDPAIIETVMAPLLDDITKHRAELWVATMGQVADWLDAAGQRPATPDRAARPAARTGVGSAP